VTKLLGRTRIDQCTDTANDDYYNLNRTIIYASDLYIYIYIHYVVCSVDGRTMRKRTVAVAAVHNNNNNDNIIIIKQTTLKKSLWMGQFRDRWTRGRWALLIKRVRRDFYILIRGHNNVYKTINILQNTYTHIRTCARVCVSYLRKIKPSVAHI
jgi:hypothetical protein